MPKKASSGLRKQDKGKYQALRERGYGKAKAALLASSGRSSRRLPEEEPGRMAKLTKQELYERARKKGIEGRSKMDKQELLAVLRRRKR